MKDNVKWAVNNALNLQGTCHQYVLRKSEQKEHLCGVMDSTLTHVVKGPGLNPGRGFSFSWAKTGEIMKICKEILYQYFL